MLILRISILVSAVSALMLGMQGWFKWPTDLTYGELFRYYMGRGR